MCWTKAGHALCANSALAVVYRLHATLLLDPESGQRPETVLCLG